MTSESSYIPGMCNINTAEVAYRRKAMWFGVVLSAIVFAALLALNGAWWLGVIFLFVPVYIAAIGYLQVRNKFCVSYGSKGQQNASEDSDGAHAVSDSDALKADKAKTRRMNLQALGATIAVVLVSAVVIYFV